MTLRARFWTAAALQGGIVTALLADIHGSYGPFELWLVLALTSVVPLLASRRVTAHALARGIDLAILTLATLGTLARPAVVPSVVAVLATLVLRISAPAYVAAADASGFTPQRGRAGFLASATAAMGIAFVLCTACASMEPPALAAGALGACLLVATLLVLHMRAVGIAVAIGAGVLAVGLLAAYETGASYWVGPIALALVTALSFPVVVVWARLRAARDPASEEAPAFAAVRRRAAADAALAEVDVLAEPLGDLAGLRGTEQHRLADRGHVRGA